VESDPYSHSESHVIWEKVVISPEGMSYENNSIEWLFYEAVISSSQNMYDSVLDYGWYIEKKGEEYIFNGICYSFDKFQLRFYDELLSIGLFPNEVDDFVEWWFDADSKLLPIDGKFALRLINSNWIDQNFIISTGYSYDQLRLFFLCHPLKEELNLKVPPPFSSDLVDLVLHEWAYMV